MSQRAEQKQFEDFVPHPITNGPVRGVIVDVTPATPKTKDYGNGPVTRNIFKVVFETEVRDDEGKPCRVRSKQLSLSLGKGKKVSALVEFLEKLLGRPLDPKEGFTCEQEYDPKYPNDIIILGKPVRLIVEHSRGVDSDGKPRIYDNVTWHGPHTPEFGEPYKAEPGYVRKKDKQAAGENGSSYQKAPPATAGAELPEFLTIKVHVGRFAGMALGELPDDAVNNLNIHWRKEVMAKEKQTADDRRLLAALDEAVKLKAPAAAAEY